MAGRPLVEDGMIVGEELGDFGMQFFFVRRMQDFAEGDQGDTEFLEFMVRPGGVAFVLPAEENIGIQTRQQGMFAGRAG